MKTKLFTLLFAVVANIGTMRAAIVNGTCGETLTWSLNTKDSTLIIEGSGAMTNYLPGDCPWLEYRFYIAYVSLPDGLTSIGERAFSYCHGLTSVTIPNNVTDIGNEAFAGCSGLTSVTVPNCVTSIGISAFYGCTGLTSVTIGNSVTGIGMRAFQNCSSLTSVTIPNSVTNIGSPAFSGCSSLSSVTINSNSIMSKKYTYNDNLQNIFGSQVTEYIIGDSVSDIGRYAFYKCTGLTSVTISNSVTSIGDYAFCNCSGLTSLKIGNSVTSIGYKAFYGCSSLTSVTINSNSIMSRENTYNDNLQNIFGSQVTEYIIGDSVTSIGIAAFSYCPGLTSVTIGNSVTSIGIAAFSHCTGLTSVTIGNSVTSIGERAFQNCTGLTSVTIGNSVTSIGDRAFSGCSSLSSVTINSNSIMSKKYTYNNNLQNIFGSQVTEYIIGDSVRSIGNYAFYKCTGLTSVTIGNSVTSIGSSAFYNCSGLTSVTIGNSVTSIGDYAFCNCSGLTSVTIEAETPPTLGNSVFTSTNNCPIYVPCNVVNVYKSAVEWRYYADRICKSHDCPNITVRLDPSSCSGWSTVRLWAWTANGNLFNSWPGQIVTKDSEGWYSYTFDKDITSVNIIWNNGTNQTVDIKGVTSSTCYALNSTSGKAITVSVIDCSNDIPSKYTIVFKDWDGSILQSKQVEEGEMPQYTGATPTRPDDGEFSYTFSGWTPTIVIATEDATYTANYTAESKSQGDGVEEVLSDQVQCMKVIRDGQILILRGDKIYTIQGQEVK